MRIDAPRGNESSLSGSFTGSFYGQFDGELAGLSGSIQEIYQTIASQSAIVSGNINALSESIDETIQYVSRSIDSQISYVSSSFDTTIDTLSAKVFSTITGVSESFSQSLLYTSESFTRTLEEKEQNLQYQINDTRATYQTTESFNNYSASADLVYYKEGSSVNIQDLLVNTDTLVKGDVTILGNISVEGSSSIIHSEDVVIKDKFVEIASGATEVGDVQGAGFGIAGAGVTMSYVVTSPTDPTVGYMNLNKPLVAVSFTGSLEGNVHGNVQGNLQGTASNATSSSYAQVAFQAMTGSYAVSASQADRAVYAGAVDEDGLIARAIKRLENVAKIKVENADRGPVKDFEFTISCCAHKDYQTCSVNCLVGSGTLMLSLPKTINPGVEHYLRITNIGTFPCRIRSVRDIMMPLTNDTTIPARGSLCLSYFTPTSESVLVTSAFLVGN